jgi:hypothetical protein
MMDDNRIKKLALEALKELKNPKRLSESRMKYDENHSERMDPTLAKQLRDRSHSLGAHPAFPEDDDMHFEERLMSKRFGDVVKNYKRHHGEEKIDINEIKSKQAACMRKVVELEEKHKDELIEMAKQLIMDDFDITEEYLLIDGTLTTEMSIKTDKKKLRIESESTVEFDNHDELVNANKEVYKRRMLNVLIQGAAKKTNHMFHLIDDKLQELNPLLPNLYSKLMTGADYMYMVNDDKKNKVIGGLVTVEFPKSENEVPTIIAEAVCLPVLIHEMVKGVMEVLSYHGLPKNPKTAQFAMEKADFMDAESWDMRLGPPIWERFLNCIPAEDYSLKHHIYTELVQLPADEFHEYFREVLMGSRKGKALINEFINKIKDEMRDDDFDNVVDRISDDDYLGPEDLDNLDTENWFL